MFNSSWSFGIVLWEIFTLGGTPYPGLPTEHLLDFLSEGKRMGQPHNCPTKVYNLMKDCWILQPECRPSFALLSELLGKFLEKNIRKVSCIVACVAGGLVVRMKNWGEGEKDRLPENLAFCFPPL